jgi:hypothetical protein
MGHPVSDVLLKMLRNPAAQGTLIFVAAYTFTWGLWLLLFNVFSRAPVYTWLSQVSDEHVFGVAGIVSGLAMAATVLRNRFPWTAYGALIGFVFWGLIGVGYFIGDYQNTSGVTAFGVSAYSAYVYLNIRLNRNEAK